MTLISVAASAIAGVLALAPIAVQTKPDVSGTWVLDGGRTLQGERDQQAKAAAGGEPFLSTQPRAERIDVTFDGKTLTIASSGARGSGTQTYVLDGAAHTAANGMVTTGRVRGQRIEIESKFGALAPMRIEISRDGAALIIRDARVEQSTTSSGQTPIWRSRTTYYTRPKS